MHVHLFIFIYTYINIYVCVCVCVCVCIFFGHVSPGKENKRKITFHKMKRQSSEWEKIFANDTSNKGLIL